MRANSLNIWTGTYVICLFLKFKCNLLGGTGEWSLKSLVSSTLSLAHQKAWSEVSLAELRKEEEGILLNIFALLN